MREAAWCGCAVLLTMAPTPARAGERAVALSPTHVYALMGGDVYVASRARAERRGPTRPIGTFRVAPATLRSRTNASYLPGADDTEITTMAWTPSPLARPIDAGFWPARQGIFPEERRARSRSPIDARLTLSVGPVSEGCAAFAVEGGVAGAMWRAIER